MQRQYNCNKYGHVGKQCWFKKNKNGNEKPPNNGFIAAFSAMQLQDHLNWYVDSGASMHMTVHRDWLDSEEASPVQSIRITDNKSLRVECSCNVTVRIPSENGFKTIQVKNVLYIPELSTNLLSVSKIIKNNCKVEFEKDGCIIYNQTGKFVAKANLTNDTYRLETYDNTIKAMSATADNNDTYLWHQRMGHLNFTDVNKIPTCTTGVKLSPNKESSVCMYRSICNMYRRQADQATIPA